MDERTGAVASFEALLVAFGADPTDLETSEELAVLADELDRWGELLSACNEWLAAGRLCDSARLSLSLTLARWCAELDRDGPALAYLDAILAEVPDHLGALEAAAEIFARHGDRALLGQAERRIAEVRRALEAEDDEDDRPPERSPAPCAAREPET